MRTCPVCGARCFDDMEVCYGCMHRFDERDGAATAVLQPLVREPAPSGGSPTVSALSPAGHSSTSTASRSFPPSSERISCSSAPRAPEVGAGVACGCESAMSPVSGQNASAGQEAQRSAAGSTRQFMQGMTVSSPPFFLDPAEGSQRYQLVISLRPCPEGVG